MKLLINTTEGAASQKSNEIDLKLDNYQLNRNSFNISGLSATWPEFWAIGLSFLDTFAFSLDTLLAHSGGEGQRLMANTILNFHFDYWHTSLTEYGHDHDCKLDIIVMVIIKILLFCNLGSHQMGCKSCKRLAQMYHASGNQPSLHRPSIKSTR